MDANSNPILRKYPCQVSGNTEVYHTYLRYDLWRTPSTWYLPVLAFFGYLIRDTSLGENEYLYLGIPGMFRSLWPAFTRAVYPRSKTKPFRIRFFLFFFRFFSQLSSEQNGIPALLTRFQPKIELLSHPSNTRASFWWYSCEKNGFLEKKNKKSRVKYFDLSFLAIQVLDWVENDVESCSVTFSTRLYKTVCGSVP